MSATTWPPRPPDRIRHGWKCTRHGATVETVRPDPNGRNRVVSMCQECGHDDLLARMRDDREQTP